MAFAVVQGLVLFCAGVFIPSLSRAQALPQDCLSAITVCSNTYVQSTTFTGFGAVQEVLPAGNSCLGNGETNSSWYLFKIKTAGNLLIDITPGNLNDDYDFVMYNLTGDSCQSILSGTNLPVRCNYSSTAGVTGLAAGYPGTSVPSGGPPFCAPLPVLAGQTYVMMINNFTSSAFGYTLSFGGTAAIEDTEVPDVDSVGVAPCNPNKISLFFSENIDSTSITTAGTEFTVTGPMPVTVLDAMVFGANNVVRVRFTGQVNVPGVYTVTINNGSDGNTLSDHCNNYIASGSSFNFTIPYQGPVASIASIQNATCNASNGSATGSASGGSGPYSYVWGTVPPQTGITATGLGPGHYSFTVTDANGCTSITTFNIISVGKPQLTLTQVNDTCANPGSGQATVTAIGGTLPYTYLWSTIPPQTTATVTGLVSGPYTVTVTDNMGCSSKATVNIGLMGKPLISFTKQEPSCDGSVPGNATAIVTGIAPFTYLWSTTPPQTTPTANSLVTGTYTVIVTDSGGCVDSAKVVIGKNQMSITTTVTNVSCGDKKDGSISLTVSGALPPLTYLWNTVPPQVTATATNLGLGTYKVVITDQSGCKDSIVETVSGPPPIVLSTSSVVTACTFSTGSATVVAAGGIGPYTYLWNTPLPQVTSTAINLPAGAYTVVVTDDIGCTATAVAYIDDSDGPLGEITSVVNATCYLPNGSATVAVNTGTAPFSFLWNTVPPQASATATGLASGEYTVQISDGNGCLSFLNVKINDIEVVTLLPGPVVNASCGMANGSATVIDSGGIGPFTFWWLTNPVQFGQTATNLMAGTYTAVVTDSAGCHDSLMVTVEEFKANSGIGFNHACLYAPTLFSGITDYPGTVSWYWDFGDPLNPLTDNSVLQNPSYTYPGFGTYTVTLYINGGCATDTVVTQVKAGYKPNASFVPEIEPLLAQSPVAFVYTGSPVTQYAWSSGTVSSSASLPVFVYPSADSIEVTLVVTDQYGCMDTVVNKYYVDYAPELFIPNSFTPNGDGKNDFFKLYSRGIESCNVIIANRWGQTVFNSDDPNFMLVTGWDGLSGGKPVPQGVYAFKATGVLRNLQPFEMAGTVTVVY